jgi:hypothetical protein
MKNKSKIVMLATASAVVAIGIMIVALYFSGVLFAKEMKITDFNAFKRIETPPQSVEVVFDDEYTGAFTITDAARIGEIHALILSRTYKDAGKRPAPGTNRTITFHYSDGTKVSLGSRLLAVSGKYYMPTQSDLLDYVLQTVGLEIGALSER